FTYYTDFYLFFFGLENRRPERVPEFESLRFRQIIKGLPNGSPFAFLALGINLVYQLVYFYSDEIIGHERNLRFLV
ncbi:hypothetical protein ACND6F_005691, partial [Escherichia coli]